MTRDQAADAAFARGIMNQLVKDRIDIHPADCHCPFCDAFDALARAL